MTDDEIDQISDKRGILLSTIQEKYGIAQEQAERQIKDWKKTHG